MTGILELYMDGSTWDGVGYGLMLEWGNSKLDRACLHTTQLSDSARTLFVPAGSSSDGGL